MALKRGVFFWAVTFAVLAAIAIGLVPFLKYWSGGTGALRELVPDYVAANAKVIRGHRKRPLLGEQEAFVLFEVDPKTMKQWVDQDLSKLRKVEHREDRVIAEREISPVMDSEAIQRFPHCFDGAEPFKTYYVFINSTYSRACILLREG